MTDRGILKKKIHRSGKILFNRQREKKEVVDMLYKNKETFSLRDDIGTCPNIEVEIDIMDKSPFFNGPYHVKEEDKNFIHKEMK